MYRAIVTFVAVVGFSTVTAGTSVDSIVIGGSEWVADEPTRVADRRGHFNTEDSSPRIRVETYGSGKTALAALRRGDVDFALAASTPVAKALVDGEEELRVLGSISQSNRTHVIIADRASGIQSPADFKDKRVAMMLGTSGEYTWFELSRAHGVPATGIERIDLDVSGHREAILSGQVDAVALWEPWASRVREALADRAVEFSLRAEHVVTWLLVTRPDVLAEHEGIARRVLAGYQRAIVELGSTPPAETTSKFGLALDWAELSDLEAQFRWLGAKRGNQRYFAPAPYEYLYGEPLLSVAPARLRIPHYFFVDESAMASRLGISP